MSLVFLECIVGIFFSSELHKHNFFFFNENESISRHEENADS